MINYHKELVAALKTVLPTHYELVLHSGLSKPCISYQEANNYDTTTGETFGYSRIVYTVKIWATDIETIQNYIPLVDAALRPLGFKRTASGELGDRNSTVIQKIMTYEADASENY